MSQVSYFKVGRILRQVVDGEATRCRHCNGLINFDAETRHELRHSCSAGDEPVGPWDAADAASDDWDDEDAVFDDDGSDEIGSRIGEGFGMRGYGDELSAVGVREWGDH